MRLTAENKRTAQGRESALIVAKGEGTPTRINTASNSSYNWRVRSAPRDSNRSMPFRGI